MFSGASSTCAGTQRYDGLGVDFLSPRGWALAMTGSNRRRPEEALDSAGKGKRRRRRFAGGDTNPFSLAKHFSRLKVHQDGAFHGSKVAKGNPQAFAVKHEPSADFVRDFFRCVHETIFRGVPLKKRNGIGGVLPRPSALFRSAVDLGFFSALPYSRRHGSRPFLRNGVTLAGAGGGGAGGASVTTAASAAGQIRFSGNGLFFDFLYFIETIFLKALSFFPDVF